MRFTFEQIVQDNVNYRQKTVAAIAAIAIGGVGLTLAAQARSQNSAKVSARQNPKSMQLGTYSIENYVNVQGSYGPVLIVNLTGPNLHLVAPEYEMSTPHLHIEAHRVGIPPQYKVTNAVATGGAHIVMHHPKNGQTIDLTCDRAVYHATTDPMDRGRLDLTGHVHSKLMDPALPKPAISDSETLTVIPVDAETTNFDTTNGNITGSIYDTAPATGKAGKTK